MRGYLDILGNNRMADQYGTLLGASLIFKHTKVADVAELTALKEVMVLEQQAKDAKEEIVGELDILNHILEMDIIGPENERTNIRRELVKEKGDSPNSLAEIIGEAGVIELNDPSGTGEKGIHIHKTAKLTKHMELLPQFKRDYVQLLYRIKGVKKYKLCFHRRV